MADQLTIAFRESRIGLNKKFKGNFVMFEAETFLSLFRKHSLALLPAVTAYDRDRGRF